MSVASPMTACEHVESVAQNGALVVRGRKLIRGDGPYLPDHFPGITIFPGVFILEAVVQTVALALGRDALTVTAVKSLRFLVPLYPGDELCFEAVVSVDPVRIKADCRRTDEVRIATFTVECG